MQPPRKSKNGAPLLQLLQHGRENPSHLDMIKGPSQAIALDSRVASSEPTSICFGRIRFNLVLDECPELFLKFGLCTLLGRGRS